MACCRLRGVGTLPAGTLFPTVEHEHLFAALTPTPARSRVNRYAPEEADPHMSQERTAASRWMSRVTIGAIWVAGVVMTTVGGNDKPVNAPVGITGLLVFLGSSAAILYLCVRAIFRWLSSIRGERRERRQWRRPKALERMERVEREVESIKQGLRIADLLEPDPSVPPQLKVIKGEGQGRSHRDAG